MFHPALTGLRGLRPWREPRTAARDWGQNMTMRKLLAALALGAAMTTAASAVTTTTASSGALNLSIPDDAYNGTLGSMLSNTLPVNTGAENTVTDVNVSVTIAHEFAGDLVIKLQGPGGQVVTLLDRPGLPLNPDDGSLTGGDSADLSEAIAILYDDEALSGVISENMGQGLLFNQTIGVNSPDNYVPSNGLTSDVLATFDGGAGTGDWTLYVADAAPEGLGRWVSWSITVTTVGDDTPPGGVIPEPVTSSMGVLSVAVLGMVATRRRAATR
jgi:subtilisin-like proprotein convertase family protein